MTIGEGVALLAGQGHWQSFLGYLATQQMTPGADRTRREKLLAWEESSSAPMKETAYHRRPKVRAFPEVF
ncbi:MAG: hypothetical protein NZ899_15050 [Thermoguttaceae bacterium]|nr:hypothetical protein [Thermoguttaceae bacterium]MDW8080242.1 hypothetical protein [Thermoguttaceae bacterium]